MVIKGYRWGKNDEWYFMWNESLRFWKFYFILYVKEIKKNCVIYVIIVFGYLLSNMINLSYGLLMVGEYLCCYDFDVKCFL